MKVSIREFLTLLLCFGALSSYTQVNLQNGSAEQSIPLVNYTNERDGLALGVSLNYSSGNGLEVNSIASPVGTGWTLNAGGYILRQQKGLPDDQQAYTNGTNLLQQYPNGFLYNLNLSQGCNKGKWVYPVFTSKTNYTENNVIGGDTEQDEFYFSFNGYAGSFVINQGNPKWEIRALYNTKLIIDYETADIPNARTTIDKFTIITPDGVKYYFEDKSYTQVMSYAPCRLTPFTFSHFQAAYFYENTNNEITPLYNSYDLNRYWGIPSTDYPKNSIVTSWYLSKIENLNTGKQIQISYNDYQTISLTGKYVSSARQVLNTNSANAQNIEDNLKNFPLTNALVNSGDIMHGTTPSNYPALGPGPIDVFYLQTIDKIKRIAQIDFPDNQKVKFKYFSPQRVDLFGDHALSTVEYYVGGRLLYQYNLVTQYFYKKSIVNSPQGGYATPDNKHYRLCLTSLTKLGDQSQRLNEQPSYKFEYYFNTTATISPALWDDAIPPRNSLCQDAGGYYNGNNNGLASEPDHDLLDNMLFLQSLNPSNKTVKSGYAKNGLLRKVTFPTGGYLLYNYTQCKASKVDFGLMSSTDFEVPGVAVSSTETAEDPSSTKKMVKNYTYVDVNNRSSKWGDESMCLYNLNFNIFNLPAAYYYVGNESYATILNSQIASTLSAQNLSANSAQGAAIANALLAATYTKNFTLNITNTNFALEHGFPIRYSRVEVDEYLSGTYNGKTIYQFTDNKVPISYNNSTSIIPVIENVQWPFPQIQREFSWAYGAPQSVTIYDKDDNKLKESFNSYNVITQSLPSKPCWWCYSVNKSALTASDYFTSASQFTTSGTAGATWADNYGYRTGRLELESTEEAIYKNNNKVLSAITDFSQDANTYLNHKSTKLITPRELQIVITYFPTDYDVTALPIMQTLIDRNLIKLPISEDVWRVKLNTDYHPGQQLDISTITSQSLVGSTVTEYSTYAISGKLVIKPYKIYTLSTSSPTSSQFDPTKLLRGSNLYRVQSEFQYDLNTGNLIQETTEGKTSSYTYDYEESTITGTAINATANDFAYTSFEGGGKGRWQFDNANIHEFSGLTGRNAYMLVSSQLSSSITKNINSSTSYYLTLWVNGNASDVKVNSNGYTDLLYTNGAWKLLRFKIQSASTVTISGDGLVDEVRLFPTNAFVSTSCFNWGIGKNTECDANNRITYYEYDAFGNVRLIKDEQGNVLKTYEYNYKF